VNIAAVREKLITIGESLPPIETSKIPLHLRLIVGNHPEETLVRMLSQLPDHWIPSIVAVAKALVEVSEEK